MKYFIKCFGQAPERSYWTVWKIFKRNFEENKTKPFHIAGDFNVNIINHDKCSKVHGFLNLLYENGMIPSINKPTRVTRKITTAIDHILTNQFINVAFKTAIFETNVSDHFPVCIMISSAEKLVENKYLYIIE